MSSSFLPNSIFSVSVSFICYWLIHLHRSLQFPLLDQFSALMNRWPIGRVSFKKWSFYEINNVKVVTLQFKWKGIHYIINVPFLQTFLALFWDISKQFLSKISRFVLILLPKSRNQRKVSFLNETLSIVVKSCCCCYGPLLHFPFNTSLAFFSSQVGVFSVIDISALETQFCGNWWDFLLSWIDDHTTNNFGFPAAG